jgi:hypothetical protein
VHVPLQTPPPPPWAPVPRSPQFQTPASQLQLGVTQLVAHSAPSAQPPKTHGIGVDSQPVRAQ